MKLENIHKAFLPEQEHGSVLILVYHSIVENQNNPYYKKNQIEKKIFEKHLRILRSELIIILTYMVIVV